MSLIFRILVCLLGVLVATCGRNETHIDNGDDGAKYLKIEPHDGYIRVEIGNPWHEGELLGAYNLVHRDSVVPESMPEGVLIRVPVESVVAYSSVHGEGLRELGAEYAIKGVTGGEYFIDPQIRKRIDGGDVLSLGPAETPDLEKMLALSPDAVMLNVYQGAQMGGVERTGLTVIKMVENMEDSPLGKAEWIRLYGALTDKLNMADSIYNSVKNDYNTLVNKVSQIKSKPTVMTENMYQGVWYVSGGKSYQARIIADAGGDYLWKDDQGAGSLNLTFEEVLERAHDADVWIMRLFGRELDKQGLLAENDRYGLFKPYKNGTIYYCNSAETDIFAISAFHPEVLLGEYVAIFHPEVGVKSRYFKKIKD